MYDSYPPHEKTHLTDGFLRLTESLLLQVNHFFTEKTGSPTPHTSGSPVIISMSNHSPTARAMSARMSAMTKAPTNTR